ncbi:MAG TPA: sulfotransferase, partial [bacterium]|nr:sulfotransferase [bacterium]
MSEGRLKVLYIAGNGRSGSTLLDVILGQIPGFFPVGEVRNVWDYGVVENRPCGCGEAFHDCPFWSRILSGAYGD